VCETDFFISARDLMWGGHHVLLVCLVVDLSFQHAVAHCYLLFLDNALLFTYLGHGKF
jgi:hypothetical protein